MASEISQTSSQLETERMSVFRWADFCRDRQDTCSVCHSCSSSSPCKLIPAWIGFQTTEKFSGYVVSVFEGKKEEASSSSLSKRSKNFFYH